MGIGAMFPFARGHSEIDTIDHEPWSFGEEVCMLQQYKPSAVHLSTYVILNYDFSTERVMPFLENKSWFGLVLTQNQELNGCYNFCLEAFKSTQWH